MDRLYRFDRKNFSKKCVLFFIYFFHSFLTGISQSLVAGARPGVATRPIFSGRLQPAGDQDRCSAARSNIEPVRNQDGSQWRTEARGKGHREEGYVSNKSYLIMIYFFPFQGQILKTRGYWWLHHQEENPVMGYWMWGWSHKGRNPSDHLKQGFV